jgi:hypothetical protein
MSVLVVSVAAAGGGLTVAAAGLGSAGAGFGHGDQGELAQPAAARPTRRIKLVSDLPICGKARSHGTQQMRGRIVTEIVGVCKRKRRALPRG